MLTGKHWLGLAGFLVIFGLGFLGVRWVFGPPPAVRELHQRTSYFPTRFPIHLARPGHYRLTSDLIVQDPDTDAIQILTYGVVLDLNGFTITGPHGVGAGRGISTGDIDQGHITIRNGTVRGFGSDGVQLRGLYQRVEEVHALENGGSGIEVGPNSVLIRNVVVQNGGSGIDVSRGESLVLQNMIRENQSHGITGGGVSWVSDNVIEDNRGEGIFVTVGALVLKNTVRRSGRNGLLLGAFVTAEENEVHGSQEAGIATYGKSNRLVGNIVRGSHGPGAKLGGPDNYSARNIFQNNRAGALASDADDSVGRGHEANVFLLESGDVDITEVTRGGGTIGDAWSR